eukprot:CAMPEP_0170593606 /NCGR_PEP_ID=MMETSP0224-20130122/13546_1 /TAXON_ID=285029 /ORGANISM="Togula jolla, Strain CCCM 725" /LENGTH=63 /DNA_ID=CAMNT_0010917587 /DNA_START=40 /DNA_END=231 /DNA_ORIENTATION=-
MTISRRLKETETEVEEVMPAVWRLHGKTPALRITKGFFAAPASNSLSSSLVGGTSMFCMNKAW